MMKKVILITLVVVSLVGCSNKESYLERGRQSLAADDYQTAEIYFRKQLQKTPRSVDARYGLSQTLIHEGYFVLASAELAKTLDIDPHYEKAQIARARLMLAGGKPQEAEKVANEILKRDPKSLDAMVLLADAYGAEGNLDAAQTEFQKVATTYPHRGAGFYGLAAVAFKRGDQAAGLSNLDRAIKVEPTEVDAYILKAAVYTHSGNKAGAVSVLKEAVAAAPKSGLARVTLGDALLANGQRKEALAIWREMAKNGPDRAVACSRAVMADLTVNKVDDAKKDLALVTEPVARTQPDYTFAKGRVLLAQKNYSAALKEFKRLTQVRPGFGPGFYYLGVCYLALKQNQKAMNALTTSVQFSPKLIQSRLLLAALQSNAAQYQEAVDNLDFILAHDDKNAGAHLLKGDCLLALKQIPQAAAEYSRALQLEPKSAIAHERAARAAMASGDFKSAIPQLEEALKIKPTMLPAAEELTIALWKTKGADAALNRLHEQVQKESSDSLLRALYGTYLVRAARYPDASRELQEALKANPNIVDAYQVLAEVYARQGKLPDAIAKLKDALSKHPDDEVTLLLLGTLYDATGNSQEAISYYKTLLAKNSRSPVAANNLAWDYASEGSNLDRALDLAQRARQLDPKNPHIADTLGFVLLKRGLPNQALPLLRESSAGLPKSSAVQYHLGLALLALKHPEEASKAFEQALKQSSDPAQKKQIKQALAEAQRTSKSN